jgi:hypothetical protein
LANEIFISYRRSDEPGYAGRLFDRLEQEFSSAGVFMDVEGIPPGHPFDEVIRRRVQDSGVVLAIIGSRWLELDGTGKSRLESSDDFVRQELEVGLEQENRVIPVLIGEANPPREEQLPGSLKKLARCQAVHLTHRQFGRDADSLIDAIKDRLAETAAKGKQFWDRTSFLAKARATRGASLEARLTAIIEWAAVKWVLRWGKGATYGTAMISPRGHDATVLSIDTSGMAYVYMENLQRLGVFASLSDRQEFSTV